ncbi:MAG: amidohydrolase family protein [Beijerinckiaceae bacterium]|nr:amidohydrolase family protein [Beijerinckiaceae bacterium]
MHDAPDSARGSSPARSIPHCPGPDAPPRGPSKFKVPAGAVDTHAHVIGLPPAYPFVAERSYTPPAASPELYLSMLDATGMSHGVLIQVSVHGTDNRLMVETLRSNRERLRGIAVVALGQKDSAYRELKEAGVVGLRINDLFGGGVGFDALADYGALCRELGWHLQFLTDARLLPDRASAFGRLPVPIVVDHMGHFPTSAGLGDPGFQTLLSLVRDGGWVKLSGAFRTSLEAYPYRDTVPFARALAEAAPDRCLWGSDWPHVAHYKPMPNVGDLLDVLHDWLPDEATRNTVLVDNPQRLYGFG